MGIIVNAGVIILGGLIGTVFKSKVTFKNNSIFAICVMLISAFGVIENMLIIKDGAITAQNLYIIVLVLAIGAFIGSYLKIEERLSNLASSKIPALNGLIDASVFFGIGGLQICGSILLAVSGDSSQLFLKSVIDFPLAMMFGAIYGWGVLLSSVPVALVQVIIATIAHFLGDFISPELIRDLNSVGYIILFFSGFNMVCNPKYKIKNSNMIPAIFLMIIYHTIIGIWS